MWKKLYKWLSCAIGAFVGVFIGHSAYRCWDYHARPELYALSSAPWYASIQVLGAVCAAAVAVCVVLKLSVRRWME